MLFGEAQSFFKAPTRDGPGLQTHRQVSFSVSLPSWHCLETAAEDTTCYCTQSAQRVCNYELHCAKTQQQKII